MWPFYLSIKLTNLDGVIRVWLFIVDMLPQREPEVAGLSDLPLSLHCTGTTVSLRINVSYLQCLSCTSLEYTRPENVFALSHAPV
jgi:hypothetical protein